jgi:Recombinase zinc beta ribbon domain
MMADNSYGGERTGAAKNGSALLAGILRCRRCGRKLMVRYTGNHHDVLRYVCRRGWLDNGEPPCISFVSPSGMVETPRLQALSLPTFVARNWHLIPAPTQVL